MRYRKILLLLLTILGVLSIIPRSRAETFHNINVEKEAYYPDEILNISASWENSKFEVMESRYEVKIFDNLNNEVWVSEDFIKAADDIELIVPIEDLSLDIIQYVGILKVSLVYFVYSSSSGDIRDDDYIHLEKRDLNHTTKGFVEELEQKETLDILIELFDVLNGTRIENYTVGIHFNENYWEENVTKSIEIHIGKEELEYGTNIIKIVFKRTLLYDDHELIFQISIKEQKQKEILEEAGNVIFLIIIIGVVSTIFGGIVYNGQKSRLLDPMEITFRD